LLLMLSAAFVVLAVGFLAYANGANDNFKGVANLFGSGTASYRTTISWAAATTFARSVAALLLAEASLPCAALPATLAYRLI
jgi:inorganic phosphate transporter, PiT family